MQIKTSIDGDGCGHVEIINPASGETVEARTVQPGQEVTVTAINAHDPSELQVGDVAPTAPPADTPAPEGEQPPAEEPPAPEGGEPQPPAEPPAEASPEEQPPA